MQDLNQIYRVHSMKKTFLNFFKSTYYKDAVDFLTEEGVPPEQIIQKTKPHRGQASMCLVHELIALAFIQWDDGKNFNRTLLRLTS